MGGWVALRSARSNLVSFPHPLSNHIGFGIVNNVLFADHVFATTPLEGTMTDHTGSQGDPTASDLRRQQAVIAAAAAPLIEGVAAKMRALSPVVTEFSHNVTAAIDQAKTAVSTVDLNPLIASIAKGVSVRSEETKR